MRTLLSIFTLFFTLQSCTINDEDFVPYVEVDGEITLTDINHNSLHNKGFTEITHFNDGRPAGVRGIIIYKVNASTYRAFEKNCSYLPQDPTSTASVDESIFKIKCQNESCLSTFDMSTGQLFTGPASKGLYAYTTSIINGGRTLIIRGQPLQ
ncbi:hypothetical protein [Aureibacter tunicatorum]|uniref:Nitrite reductase/ring-hydroxylating ferredoxin subunit n=1 Tax=Aureibacter tunicatorum TaxID=866807 RepID=A0AAE3XP99_9BACT|nr:hypothetical protein [Aureibacter tunicatorum]MDR6240140.1 nitrite reductase/ring-hydroxylating ferredoxin subunit [Aureibacter tunicatorum]BDD05979.1 hypothetical protein AUTU_34620 [Aureibacter tunicatorum]